ncbi:post-transcriptional regulator [Alicyclobacillus acidoterrestris]|uniref:Post-transcriptional regulator n=1 Tax=Alicyclobacillus acidoterrestris (strain ATCC 49025 / DSM 3922 / CIP 106132 / NCIMB 13137 / GD3B) TaxID=1356854 RepID=T0C9B1_ALIAG|nr:post-transcriptional regulator [Alicyclobacillus acidoterrestris]EPZ52778.1 hypothetical protein N007_02300 [Alicyclobacillus acidoterrestris ATCC 49025]UNO48175.1 post-transcriptional regulator [Alicyclobacillus acidoterrestris]
MNPQEAPHIRPYITELMSLCATKVEEFRLLGYEEVNLDDVWRFVCAKLPNDAPIHRIVDFILSIRVMDFMNYQTIEAFRGEL